MAEQMQDHAMTTRTSRPTFGRGLIFILVILGVGALLGFFVVSNRSVDGPLVPQDRPVPISVSTLSAAVQPAFKVEEKFTGIVTPRRTSQLGFASGGRIDGLRVDIGDRVSQGQTMAVLDTRTLRAQLASAEAVIAEARAAYDLAETTVDRQISLLERGHVSSQVVDEARAQSNTANARIAAAQANADALRVQIDLAQISAPFSGTVTERMVDEGAIAGPGQPIFELVETEFLEARIGLTAKLADQLEIDQSYPLISDQGTAIATLRSVTGVIDASNRTVTTVFDIDDPSAIAAGAVVRLGLERDINERGLWLPVSALTEADRGLWSIYKVRGSVGNYTAEPGIVEILHQDGERVFVRGSVRDGERVIIDGLQRITPGQPVTPVDTNSVGLVAGNG
ncbi:MAG: efflux RND transporter periplasmic adaptor subunit [Pseudomonadota bacterium]